MGTTCTAQFKKGIYIIFHDEPHGGGYSFCVSGKGVGFLPDQTQVFIYRSGGWNIPINREKRLKK